MKRSGAAADVVAPAVAAIGPFLVYVATLAPTVTLEDSGSFIVAARYLGVAHPSGFPLWCLLAHPFTWLPVGTVAQRVHLSSATFAAGACWLLYVICRRLTGSRLAALLAALAFGFSHTLWSQAVVAEVYALNALFVGLVLWLAMVWRETQETRWLLLLALSAGLALANHTLIVLVVAVASVWAVVRLPRRVLSAPLALRCLGLLALGLAVYLYLPLRARTDPPVNWGDPATLAKTWHHVRRADYLSAGEQARYLGTGADIARHTLDGWGQTAESLTWPIAILGLAGLWRLVRTRRDVAGATLAVFLLHTLAFNAYVRARYTPFWCFEHRVFYIPAHMMVALWASVGLAWLVALLRGREAGRRVGGSRARAAFVAVLAGLLVMWPLARGLRVAGQRAEEAARDFGLDLLAGLPRDAGILPMGDSVVFGCLYLKCIEDLRPDVQILSPAFGWRGERVSALFAINPLTEGVREAFPWLQRHRAVPFGLGYLYVKDEEEPPTFAWPELPRARVDALLGAAGYDPFLDGLRATYAVGFVHSAMRDLALGRPAAAMASFDEAERLNPRDPFVSYSLARAYHEHQLRSERVCELLAAARQGYDASVDPAAQRFYGVSPVELARVSAAWCEASGR